MDELSKKYSDDVKSMITKVREGGRNIAGFIAESLQSCGGQVILPPGYLRNVYKYVQIFIKSSLNMHKGITRIYLLHVTKSVRLKTSYCLMHLQRRNICVWIEFFLTNF